MRNILKPEVNKTMRGTITKKGENKWMVRIFVGRDAGGRVKHFNKTINGSKKDAPRLLTAEPRERDFGGVNEPSSEPLKDCIGRWVVEVASTKVREATVEGYKDIVRIYLIPDSGSRRLCDLRPEHVQQLYGK